MHIKLRNWDFSDLHLFWCVILWCPVWDSTHPHVTIPKLLTESSILGLRVSTSVRIMEGNVKEKWPLFILYSPPITFFCFSLLPSLKGFLFTGLEKLADQEFDASDVPPHLEDGTVFLCVGKVKGVNRSRANVLLSNYTCENEFIFL